jgi:hypothetical protein
LWFRPVECSITVETALRLTAVSLLLEPMGPWFVLPIILGLAALMLASPELLRTPVIWIGLSMLVVIRIASDWPLADNHIYLLAYWCLAIALALRAVDASAVLAWNGRWLLGLAFALAVLWKGILSPDYVDGRFFRVTLLTDPRFSDVATLVSGLTPAELDRNRTALDPLPEGAELLAPLEVAEPWRLRVFAAAATWSTLLFEACVALAFLLDIGTQRIWLRHALLLGFCLTTYAFAPVAGFGWLLLVLGLAQCDDDWRQLRITYVAVFLLVLVYAEVPWAGLLIHYLS